MLEEYDSDEKLLEKIQTGRGDPEIFEGNQFLFVEGFFAGTDPATIEQ